MIGGGYNFPILTLDGSLRVDSSKDSEKEGAARSSDAGSGTAVGCCAASPGRVMESCRSS